MYICLLCVYSCLGCDLGNSRELQQGRKNTGYCFSFLKEWIAFFLLRNIYFVYVYAHVFVCAHVKVKGQLTQESVPTFHHVSAIELKLPGLAARTFAY